MVFQIGNILIEFPFSWTAIFLTALTSLTSWYAMGFFSRKNEFPVKGRTVLLTGGSQGMGKAVAETLARKGANVVIVARDVKKLEAAVQDIKAAAASPESQKFHYISADLTDPTSASKVISETTAWNDDKSPDIVWCCAGSAYPEFFVNHSPESLKSQMETNYLGSAYIAQEIIKAWSEPKPTSLTLAQRKEVPARHLIFTASIVSFYPLVGYSAYSPAKAALRSLSDTLSQELQLYNGLRRSRTATAIPEADIKIHTIFPATILSPGLDNENKAKPDLLVKLEEDDEGQTPQQVSDAAFKGLEKGEYLITTVLIGSALRAVSYGVSPRNDWLLDNMFASVMQFVWRFIQSDMDGKVAKWGRDKGIQAKIAKDGDASK